MSAPNKQSEISIRTVLLATDFEHSSRVALGYAADVARRFQARLVLVHAFELDPVATNVEVVDHKKSRTRRDAEARLQAFASEVESVGITTKQLLIEGTVPSAILKSISKYDADLLVLGTQGVRKGVSHFLLGSNTEALMLSSPCPTLTIGPHVPEVTEFELGLRRIAYISDFTAASARAVPIVERLSAELDVPMEMYQLLAEQGGTNSPSPRQLAEEFCAALKALGTATDQKWCSAEFQLEHIRRADKLLPESLYPSTLIVLGVESTSFLGRHLHTSYAYRLLANAACPIVTIPRSTRGAARHPVSVPQFSTK